MKFNQLSNNFTSGELSETLHGRVDLEEFKNGLARMQNFFPLKQGGAALRGGFRFYRLQSTGGGLEDLDPLLLDFHSADYSYMIAIKPGTQNIQIYRTTDNTACTVSAAAAMWTKDHFLSDATKVQSYTAAQRYQVQYAQSGDLMVILDGTGRAAPMVIRRTSDTAFAVVPFFSQTYFDAARPSTPTQLRMAYADPNTSATTFTPSVTTGAGTITASVATFTGDWIGRVIKITHAGVTGMALVTGNTSSTVLAIQTYVNFGATTASTNWETSQWGGDAGFPRSLCFFEGRLVFGGSPLYPDTTWLSEAGDIFHFMQRRLVQDASTDVSGLGYFGAVVATDAFSFIPASREANNICWVVGASELQIGTDKTEYIATGGQEQALSISSIFVKDISNHGSFPTQPRRVSGDTIFVGQDGKTLRALTGQSIQSGFCPELSVLATGLIENTVPNQTSYDPYNDVQIVWLVWNDTYSSLFCIARQRVAGQNRLFALAYDKTSKTTAFWRPLVDAYASGICSLADFYDPDPTNASSSAVNQVRPRALWAAFSRTLGGVNVTTIERMNAPYSTRQTTAEMCFMDCMQSFFHVLGSTVGPVIATGLPQNTVLDVVAGSGTTGVNLLPAKYTVDVSGNITLAQAYQVVLIGFRYQGQIKTLPVEAGQTFGQAQGSPRRMNDFIIRFFRSRGGVYYFNPLGTPQKFDLLTATEATSQALSSIEKKLSANSSPWDTQLTIEQNQPYPMTILWFTLRGVTQDG